MMLRLRVSDMTGDRRTSLRLPGNRTIAQVRPQVLEALWPTGPDWLEDDRGETTWNLYNISAPGEPLLADTDRVADVLRSGQEVRVEPNMIAGDFRR